MKIVITGGGTAGHVVNALALADRLRDDHGAVVSFIGSPDGQEARLVPEAGYAFHPVRVEKMVRELSWRTLRAPAIALRSVRDCGAWVENAGAVVGMGGYVSAPGVLAARRAHVPVVLHEQNAIPGIANRLLARLASVVALTFAEAAARLPRSVRTVVTGNPVRGPVLAVGERRPELAVEAIRIFGLDAERRTVLVAGGSQGARRLNDAVVGAATRLRGRSDLQLLVSTGRSHLQDVASAIDRDAERLVHLEGFITRMELAYAVADLAVSRAGANSVSELAVAGVPSILVPYPHATGRHQEANARALEAAGAARVIDDDQLNGTRLAASIEQALGDPEALERMRSAAAGWAHPDAARDLSNLVAEAAA